MTAPTPDSRHHHLSPAELFGDIDIYLFDQILRGRFEDRRRILDAGCGRGRNLRYFLRSGYEVYAVDRDPEAVSEVRGLVRRLAPGLPPANVMLGSLGRLPWAAATFDAVVANAVLHFAADEEDFQAMVRESWRVLRSGGMLFTRLASSIGMEGAAESLGGRRYRQPDGDVRFLVDEGFLVHAAESLGARQLDPIKTTNVQGRRCMTTWCLAKP